MAIQHADVLVGLQAGDEGKGKVAHHMATSDNYDLVLRYNGGSNAGHTVYVNGDKVVTHQVPVGVLKNIPSIIGPGCVVNLPKLREEIQYLNDMGFDTEKLVLVDRRTHIVTEDHLKEDGSDTKIGTTRQGIGPAYRDKYGRTGTRVGDVVPDLPKDLFRVIDIYDYLHRKDDKYRILCEGAQGFHLDIDWGEYPYVTTSHCTVGSACLNGIPPHKIRKVIGTMKAYETYVGNRDDYTVDDDVVFQSIQQVGQEYGATTGRPRKVNWLNLDKVIQAIQVNGVTDVIINKADVLQKVGAFSAVFDKQLYPFDGYGTFNTFVTGVLRQYVGTKVTWSLTANGI